MKVKTEKSKGITLVALVITIIILLILAGITIATLTGENGLFTRAKEAKEKTQREAATEKINLVIADVYTKSYAEKQENPTLQDLADGFCEDEETEYVDIATRKTSAIDKIEVGTNEAIYVKLKKYPYEFKIDNNIKIASIDGENVSEGNGGSGNSGTGSDSSGSTDNPNGSGSIDLEEYRQMQETIAQMQETIAQLQQKSTELETTKAEKSEIENNYATKQYVDDLPQNVGNYTDLDWTLIAKSSESSWKKIEVDIDEYNYICVTCSNKDGAAANPSIMSVKQFKILCNSQSYVLSSCWYQGRYSAIYYNSGLFLSTANSSDVGRVYGIK